MGKQGERKAPDPEWRALEARVEEHLRAFDARLDSFFAGRGEERPADSRAFFEQLVARRP